MLFELQANFYSKPFYDDGPRLYFFNASMTQKGSLEPRKVRRTIRGVYVHVFIHFQDLRRNGVLKLQSFDVVFNVTENSVSSACRFIILKYSILLICTSNLLAP